MNQPAIQVTNVSKKYSKTLKRSMLYGLADVSRNLLGMRSHSEKLRKDEFWALDDISFEVNKGETVGIIGSNGSGKTTLLKMLNGIFWPDKGKISINGSVGSLIEVGAGFHPLLTGRENIYVNAAILGMSKEEVNEKFDSIVDFSGIGDFLDTPVKHYSSGMFVRLGFSIAAHCEPDILLVDEILAVGDTAFRIKCYNMMSDITKRTSVLLVSHDLTAVSRICKKCLLINHGKLEFYGDTFDALNKYSDLLTNSGNNIAGITQNDSRVSDFTLMSAASKSITEIQHSQPMTVRFSYNLNNIKSARPLFVIHFISNDGTRIGHCISNAAFALSAEGKAEVTIPKMSIRPGVYHIGLVILDENLLTHYFICEQMATLRVTGRTITSSYITIDSKWEFK